MSGRITGTDHPALMHFNGTLWSMLTQNLRGLVMSMAEEKGVEEWDDDTMWMVAEGKLWRGLPQYQSMTEVRLPDGAGAAYLVWTDENGIWVLAESGLYTTAALTEPIEWPSYEEEMASCQIELPPAPKRATGVDGQRSLIGVLGPGARDARDRRCRLKTQHQKSPTTLPRRCLYFMARHLPIEAHTR